MKIFEVCGYFTELLKVNFMKNELPPSREKVVFRKFFFSVIKNLWKHEFSERFWMLVKLEAGRYLM